MPFRPFDRLGITNEDEIFSSSPPELVDLPEDFWNEAVVVIPPKKEPISLRIDGDVLAWFRAQGAGYQTRMNAVLRAYMTATTG